MIKRITLFALTLGVLLVAGRLNAQQFELRTSSQPQLRTDSEGLEGFGYAERTFTENYDAIGTGKPNVYLGAYIELKGAGNNKLTHISFGLLAKDGATTSGKLIVISGDRKKVLLAQDVPTINAGNNNIALNEPFALEEGKTYYAGFMAKSTSTITYPLGIDKSVDIPEASWISILPTPLKQDQTLQADGRDAHTGNIAGQGFGALLVFVTLENMKPFENMMLPIALKKGSFELVNRNEEVEVELQARNIGTNKAEKVEVSAQLGKAEAQTIALTPSPALEAGKSGNLTFKVKANQEGMGQVKFAVTKINDADNKKASQTVTTPFLIGDNDAQPRETFLLERFTTENCGYCPGADPHVKNLIQKMEAENYRVSMIAHHAGFGTDFLTLNESLEITDVLGVRGAPGMSFNRTYIETNQDKGLVSHPGNVQDFVDLFNKEKQTRRGVRIESILQKEEGDKVSITVKGKVLKGAHDPENTFLTIVITEDNIAAKKQSGAGPGYKHHAVPRKFLTPYKGDLIQAEADGSFTVTKEVSVAPNWKVENCKVVVVAHNNIRAADIKARKVHTSETAKFKAPTATEYFTKPATPLVYALDGYLTIEGEVDALEVYNIAGQLITDSYKTRLEPGVYVVRTYKDLEVFTTKVVVR